MPDDVALAHEMKRLRVSVGQMVARYLQAAGVTNVFGIPGVLTSELYRGLADAAAIQHVTPRHEQGAAFMADGYARASGRPAVCCVISGPGLMNAGGGIGEAYADAIPMLVLTAQNPRDRVGLGRGLPHELFDQTRVASGLTDLHFWPDRSEAVLEALDRSFSAFRTERPRPAIIELSTDLLAADAHDPDPVPRIAERPAPPEPTALAQAAAWLAASKRPILIVGGGAQDSGALVAALADRLDAPIILTSSGKGSVAEDAPLVAGTGPDLACVQREVAASDVAVMLGTQLGGSDTFIYGAIPFLPDRTIQVDIDPRHIGINRAVDLGIVGDLGVVIESLLARLPAVGARHGVARAATLRQEILAEVRGPVLVDSVQPWLPFAERAAMTAGEPIEPWLLALRSALPRDAVLSLDVTRPVTYGAPYLFPSYVPRTWLRPQGNNALGYAVPAAIGAKVARPDRAVVAMVGDGGFMFTALEIIVAVELGLSLPIVIWNDHSYGEIARAFHGSGIPSTGTMIRPADFPALSRSLGGEGTRVSSPQELEAAVVAALSTPLPTVIEIDAR